MPYVYNFGITTEWIKIIAAKQNAKGLVYTHLILLQFWFSIISIL